MAFITGSGKAFMAITNETAKNTNPARLERWEEEGVEKGAMAGLDKFYPKSAVASISPVFNIFDHCLHRLPLWKKFPPFTSSTHGVCIFENPFHTSSSQKQYMTTHFDKCHKS